MEVKVDSASSKPGSRQQTHPKDEKVPLLKDEETRKTAIQRAISQTFESTAHLANLLPTGTVLAFQLLAPVVSGAGESCDGAGRMMTAALVGLCAASCFVLSFSDSFKDASGGICYVLATPRGLWVIDGSPAPPAEVAKGYKVRFIDCVHAVMSAMLFCAVAMFDQSVVGCLYPAPSGEAREVLTALPVCVGVFCGMLFVVFPTKRHGIGFPLSVC